MNPQDSLKAKAETNTPLSRSAQRALEAAKHKAAVQQKILLILLGIALIINAIAGYLLYQKLVVEQQQINLHTLTQEKVDERSKALAHYFKQQTQLFDKLATEAELINGLDVNNPDNTAEQRAQLERKWLHTTPSALNIRLIPIGTAQLDREAEFPIRYAELDLIRRAEERQAALPELINVNDRWMLNWIRPLAADEKSTVLGTLLVTIDAAELINLFSTAEQSLGELVLLQQFTGSPPQMVKKLGAGAAGNSMQSNVSGSHLVVKFTPSEQLLLLAEELPALWLSITSLIVAGSLALVWFLSKILVRIELGEKSNVTPSVADVVKTSKESVSSEEAMTNPLFQKQDILDIAMIDEDEIFSDCNRHLVKRPAVRRAIKSTRKTYLQKFFAPTIFADWWALRSHRNLLN